MGTRLTNTRGWDLDRALRKLRVRKEGFPEDMHGYAAGYSYTTAGSRRSYLAIDPQGLQTDESGNLVPIAREMVAFHELGHIVLGHTHTTANMFRQGLPRDEIEAKKEASTPQYEAEAQMVAMECARRLGVPAQEATYSALEYYIGHFKKQYRMRHGQVLVVDRVKINDAVEKILAAGFS